MKPVSPRNYDLTFEPDLKKFRFDGTERVQIEVAKPTSEIVLNAAELEIRECSVFFKNKVVKASFSLDEKKEQMTIRLAEKIVGKAELHVKFSGALNDRLVGFYRSQSTDQKGRKRFVATTQFEAADARRAFPCWDEPEAKATFDVSILADPGLDAISNMPVAAKKRVGRKNLFRFARTPVMSTYLLFLSVGEFDFLEGRLGKVSIRIVTGRGKKHLGAMALDFTKKFLDYYQKYFGIPYPLPKLDMIAVSDFASGAMENWGAITFRETILLFDPKTSSTATKQHIAEVISHELAHQWFGNLVTMKWWNDLWLNESFATFMATKAVDHYYPEWDLWDQFLEQAMNDAFGLDALKTSHPIEVEVRDPGEVREIFDEISYEKGGTVLRMLEDFLGDESFRLGLKNYLTKHRYGNAVTNDLWDALAATSHKPVRELMDSWVRQVGYPMVEANVVDSKISLTQSRFLLEGNGKSDKAAWMIPVYVKMRDRFLYKLMTKRSESIALDNADDWFVVNSGRKGLYRVKYGRESLDRLKDLIENKRLGNADRWGVQNDLFAMCVAGEMRLKEYLDFIGLYLEEDDYIVSLDIADSIYSLYLITSGEKFWGEIKRRGREYFGDMFERLGWDPKPGERHTDALLRSFVINVLGRLGDEKVVSEAKRRFDVFLRKPDSLSPDIRGAVYSLVAWSGDASTHDTLTGLYRKAGNQEEKMRFLGALSSFQDEALLSKTLEFSLSPEVRLQDLYIPIGKCAGNPYGRKLVWPWIKKNWKGIGDRFGHAGSPLLNRIVSTAGVINDASREAEVRDFFRKNPVPGTERKIAQTLERIRISSRFLDRCRKEFGS